LFLLLVLVPSALAQLYLWKRLVKDTTRPGRWRTVGTVAILALLGILLGALLLPRWIGPQHSGFAAWPGYLWLAMVLYLTLALAVLEVPRLVIGRRARAPATPTPQPELVPAGGAAAAEPEPEPVPEPEVDTGRRLFLARSLALAAGAAATGVVGYGANQALGAPLVKQVPVSLRRLDPALAGFRIAVVADIHLGPLLGRSHTERIVATINGLRPDLVAIVGDLVDGTVAELGEAAAPLRDLVSPHGSFFVTGNHEYFSDARAWLAELARLDVHPLRNERLTVRRGAANFDLAGINDVTGRGHGDAPDLGRALEGRDTTRPVVLLAHQPVQVADAARRGVDLQLSGHTHGGQMVPLTFLVQAQQHMLAGLVKVQDTWLYVTRGAGFWGPPVRVGAPPDITVVELRPAPN